MARTRVMAIVLAVSAWLVSTSAAQAAQSCTAETIAELPVTMSERRPLVKVTIDGVEQIFMADSGAVISMFSPKTAARLKLPLHAAPRNFAMGGVGGAFDVKIATVRRFGISGQVLNDVNFLVGGSEAGIGALLGQNVLAIADTQYDLNAGTIRLVKASDCGDRAVDAWAAGQPYSVMDIEPLTVTHRHVTGSGAINGAGLRVVFDTGSPTTLLSLAAAQRAGINPGAPGVIPAGSANGVGGTAVPSWIAPAASYRLGGRDMRGDPLRIADLGALPYDLLIGADFFLAHRVYVAASRGKLYFTHVEGTKGGQSFPILANAEAYARRGAQFAEQRDVTNAIADFTRAIEMAPNEPRYLVLRAAARLDAQQALLARDDLDRAIQKKPDLVDARFMRAVVMVADKNFGQAQVDLDAASRAAPRAAHQRFNIAALYASMEDWEHSYEQFDMWIPSYPDDPRQSEALNARCWAGAMTGKDLPKALGDCEAALRMQPDRPDFLDSRGMVYLRMGRLDAAIADYDGVLAKLPNLGWSLFGRGLAKIRKGRDGRPDITAAVALVPDLPEKARRVGLITLPADPR